MWIFTRVQQRPDPAAALSEFRQRNPWFRSLTDAELAPALVTGEPVECLERLGHLAALLRLDLPIVDLSGVDADTVRRTIEALPAGNALR